MKKDRVAVLDLKLYQRKLEKYEKNRLQRLKEAREKKSITQMINNIARNELKQVTVSAQQRLAIALMVDHVHQHTYDYIAKKVGITIATLSNWRTDPVFLRELNKEIDRRTTFIRIHAMRNVHNSVLRGNMKDTWKYLEMTGDLRNRHEIVDRTGEVTEMDDNELTKEIESLTQQLTHANTPSDN